MRTTLLCLVFLSAAAIAPSAGAAGDPNFPPPMASAPADPDYENGRKAVETKDWKAAVGYFGRSVSRDPKNANAQNYLGYSYRKSGNLDMAFKHYEEALRLDPGHRGAHEYLGEAYLIVNNLPKAEEHLKALDRICFFSCEEYRDLKQAVEEYKRVKK